MLEYHRIDKGGKLNIKDKGGEKEREECKRCKPSRFGKVLFCVFLYYSDGNFLIGNTINYFCT